MNGLSGCSNERLQQHRRLVRTVVKRKGKESHAGGNMGILSNGEPTRGCSGRFPLVEQVQYSVRIQVPGFTMVVHAISAPVSTRRSGYPRGSGPEASTGGEPACTFLNRTHDLLLQGVSYRTESELLEPRSCPCQTWR